MASTEPSVFRVKETVYPHITGEICPLCDQPIPPHKLVEIQQRERDRAEMQKRQLRQEFEKEKDAALALKQAELEQVQKNTADAIEASKKEFSKREAAAKAAGKTEAETVMKAKLDEVEDAKKEAEDHLKTFKADEERLAEQRLQKALSEQRESMDKAMTEAVQKEQKKAFEERQKIETELSKVQRQVKNQRADELGEEAELVLSETLREAFDGDRFRPIDKGVAGADLWQNVVHDDQACGRIVYDSKNRNAWRNDYVSKLKVDQLNADGDYAVLLTRVFPSGARQLHVQDGVFVVHPARVVAVVTMLRDQLIQTHRLKLSAEERETKTEELYDFINSERCHQIFEHHETIMNGMLDLDVAEHKQHEKNWTKRAQYIKKAQRAIQVQLLREIKRIISDDVNS